MLVTTYKLCLLFELNNISQDAHPADPPRINLTYFGIEAAGAAAASLEEDIFCHSDRTRREIS